MEAPKHFKFKELYKRRKEAIDINLRRQKQVRFIRNARLEKLQLENIRGMDEDSANREMMRLDGISKGLGYEVPEQVRKQKLVYGRTDNNRNMQMMPSFSVINSLNNLNDNIMGINDMLPFDKRLYQFIIPDIAKLNREGFVSDQVLVIDTDKNEYALYNINDLMEEFPVKTQSQMNGYIRRIYINDRLILSYVNNKDSMFMSKLNKLNDIARPVDSFDDFDNMIVTKAITGRKDETVEVTKQEGNEEPSPGPDVPSIIPPESQGTEQGPKIEEEPSSSEYDPEQFKEKKEQEKKEDLTSSSRIQEEMQKLKDKADNIKGIHKGIKKDGKMYKGTSLFYKNAIIMFKHSAKMERIFKMPIDISMTDKEFNIPSTHGSSIFDKCVDPSINSLTNTSEFFYGSIGYLDAAYRFTVEPLKGITKVDIDINGDLSNLVRLYNTYLSAFNVMFILLFIGINDNIKAGFKQINPAARGIPESFADIDFNKIFTEEELTKIVKKTEEHYNNVKHPYAILKMILSYSSKIYNVYGNLYHFQNAIDRHNMPKSIIFDKNEHKTLNKLKEELTKLNEKLENLDDKSAKKKLKIKIKKEVKDKRREITNLKVKINRSYEYRKKEEKKVELVKKYAMFVFAIKVLAKKYKNIEKYIPTFDKKLFK